MAFTGHGHHIPGTEKGSEDSWPSITRCGGVWMCPRCRQDVEQYMGSVFGVGEEFQTKAKRIVKEYIDNRIKVFRDVSPPAYEVYVSTFSKVLKGWKATVGTTLPDRMYYELTYDHEARETYLDVYQKVDNVHVPD